MPGGEAPLEIPGEKYEVPEFQHTFSGPELLRDVFCQKWAIYHDAIDYESHLNGLDGWRLDLALRQGRPGDLKYKRRDFELIYVERPEVVEVGVFTPKYPGVRSVFGPDRDVRDFHTTWIYLIQGAVPVMDGVIQGSLEPWRNVRAITDTSDIAEIVADELQVATAELHSANSRTVDRAARLRAIDVGRIPVSLGIAPPPKWFPRS